MQRLALAVLLFSVFLASTTALAICNNCEPKPNDGAYADTVAARPQPQNARGLCDDGPCPHHRGGGGAQNVIGSSSYTYAIPILHLPGRNGLDVDLTLYYNSRVWSKSVNTYVCYSCPGGQQTIVSMTFNADRDFPSYGFRLDYGFLESSGGYILTEGTGSKHQLIGSADSYNSNDSTYINYQPSLKTLTYKNGTKILYEQFPTKTTLFRPIKITDTNGNFITISYVSGTDHSIDKITDTLSRVIQFGYGTGSYAVTCPR